MNITADKRINPGSEVQMHFTIKLTDGSVADSTLPSGRPACFILGDNSMTDIVEQSIIGLQAGDKKSYRRLLWCNRDQYQHFCISR